MFNHKFCYVDGAPSDIWTTGTTDTYSMDLNGYKYDSVTLDKDIHRYLTNEGRGKKTRLYCAHRSNFVNVVAIKTENGETLKTDSAASLLVWGFLLSLLVGGATLLLSWFPMMFVMHALNNGPVEQQVSSGFTLSFVLSIGMALLIMRGFYRVVRMRNNLDQIPAGSIEKAGKKIFGVNVQPA